MNLSQMAEKLGLQSLTPEVEAGNPADITGGYVSDLLSDVLAHAPNGGVLVTIQVHMNVIAVSVHAGLAAVIFASGRKVHRFKFFRNRTLESRNKTCSHLDPSGAHFQKSRHVFAVKNTACRNYRNTRVVFLFIFTRRL